MNLNADLALKWCLAFKTAGSDSRAVCTEDIKSHGLTQLGVICLCKPLTFIGMFELHILR